MATTVLDDTEVYDFIADCTLQELRAALAGLASVFPGVAAAAIEGIQRGRLERDQDALRRAVTERSQL